MLLSTVDLSKRFDRHQALDSVNLQVRAGEVYGLIGPNGAGKTTLLRLLALADEPTTGEVFLDGALLRYGEYLPQQKRRLGYLPDDYPLYEDLSVQDYLDYMARLYFLKEPDRSARIQEVLGLVQLESKARSLINTLSRGMKQRLSLAQSILHRPALLLMDEPVSGLDPLARSQFCTIIKDLQASGMTIVISSHILSDLEDFCTSIGVMEQGRLVESAVLSDLYQRLSHQHLMISVVGQVDRLREFLSNRAEVSAIEATDVPTTLKVVFTGDSAARSKLLKDAIGLGLDITDFHATQENLESIFLKMDYQRTA